MLVYLDKDLADGYTRPDNGYTATEGRDELVEELRDRIRYLEEESRRKDHLLAAALERIPPAIESPPDERESPETVSETGTRGEDRDREGEAEWRERSWWRRLLNT